MLIWFIIATAVLIGVFSYCIKEEDHEPIFPALLIYVLLAFFPSFVHTTRTDVVSASDKEYRIYITSQYSALLLSDIADPEPDTKKLTNAYLLYKIQLGEYKVVKHISRNMWGQETMQEYFVLSK